MQHSGGVALVLQRVNYLIGILLLHNSRNLYRRSLTLCQEPQPPYACASAVRSLRHRWPVEVEAAGYQKRNSA